MATRSAIKAVEISKKYKLSRKTTTSGLVNVSFEMDAKGFVAIMGKTGSGKSTLLNLLGSIDSPTDGHIEYMGDRLDRMNRRRINMYRQKIVAFVFQEYYLISSLTVYENIELALKLSDTDPEKIDETILEALSSVGLDAYSTRMPGQLSGGEKQRVAIARAIAKNAQILLCDEPTGNLDKETATGIM
ncbi:MAG TPA: ATP-binding cassette domain-containing protein, partial [Bacillota bacterium]|nr:ATP-binding cassette domain-containing protein [Bacillota bacterium]